MGQMEIVMRSEAEKHLPEVGPVAETDWLAFAYVVGELDGAELAEWTARLAGGDVEACEAVAGAVELIQAVGSPGRPSVVTDTVVGNSDSRVAQWRFVVAAVVCLVLVVVLSWKQGDQAVDELTGDLVPSATADDELLSSWAGGTDAEVAELGVATGPDALVAETELVVPEWMIAALALPPEMDGEDGQ
jgi:hypothetical protein